MEYERDAGFASPFTRGTVEPDGDLAALESDLAQLDSAFTAEEPLDRLSVPTPYETWSEDPEISVDWRIRRPRRIAVKLFGWCAVAVSMFGLFRIAEHPAARSEMATWATMGQLAGEAKSAPGAPDARDTTWHTAAR